MSEDKVQKHKDKLAFIGRVSEMPNDELVATYQYVSGLFARQQEQMYKGVEQTAEDMNILKHELLYRLKIRVTPPKGLKGK